MSDFDAEDYLDDNIGIRGRAGTTDNRELILDECPFCGDTGAHFYLNVQKKLFNCYSCDEAGTLTKLIVEVEGVTYGEAKAMLMRGGVTKIIRPLVELLNRAKMLRIDGKPDDSASSIEPVKVALPAEFKPCFDKATKRLAVPTYLKQRNITAKMMIRFGIGYAESGRYRGRIIWPVSTAGSSSFVARLSDDGAYGPKYLNPDEAPMIRFLYNYDRIPVGVERLFVTEGVADVNRWWSYGLDSLALFGKGLSEERIGLILRLKPKAVYMALDPDALTKAVEMAQQINGLTPTKVMFLSNDPDRSTKTEAFHAISTAARPDSVQILKWRNSLIKP